MQLFYKGFCVFFFLTAIQFRIASILITCISYISSLQVIQQDETTQRKGAEKLMPYVVDEDSI